MIYARLIHVVSYAGTPSSIYESPLKKKLCSRIINREAPIWEPVNENHPVVKDLLLAGYNPKESIDAVGKCETCDHDMTLDTDRTLESALEYLAQMRAEEDGEGELLPSTERHLFRDEFKMEWLDL